MIKNIIFKKIPISFKKFYPYSKILSNKPILFFFSLNFSNKINNIIKKISFSLINCFNSTKIFIKNFIVGKSIHFKKINYRAKGRINFIIKRYTNLKLIIYG